MQMPHFLASEPVNSLDRGIMFPFVLFRFRKGAVAEAAGRQGRTTR